MEKKERPYSAQSAEELYERLPTFVAREEVLKLAQQEKYRPLSYFASLRPEAITVLDFIKLDFPCMLLNRILK